MTYGRMIWSQERARWVLFNLSPHVAIALKRLFPRIPERATVIEISDSDETRADLEWFMLRYPLEHNFKTSIAQGASRIKYRMAERDRILTPDWEPAETTGFKRGYKPYKYQQQAAQITIGNGGLLLGDDVGLGKTISAITVATAGAPLPMVVVVQAHLAFQWRDRIQEFTHLRVHVIETRKPYQLPTADIYVFRYSNIIGWIDVFAQLKFQTVVWDEIQELRHGSGTSKGAASIVLRDHAQVRMGLTATPVYNYGDEMHQIMEFVRPGLLGDGYEFRREWCGNSNKVKDPDALGSYLRDTGYFLRRNEDDETVNASMPPHNILDWEVECDLDAVADEESLIRTLASRVVSGSFAESGKAARELDIKLRQLTGIGKARSVAAYVKLLLRDSERVLLAGWHREVYTIWQQALAGFNPVLYTGTETNVGKQRSVHAFTKGDSRVMMISLRSGAGLDGLQHYCNEVVIGEFDWSPQVHHQVFGRVRRPGQKRQVNGHYLHTDWGSDPVIMEMLGIKSDQSRGINEPGIAPRAKFSDESRIKRLAEHVLAAGS